LDATSLDLGPVSPKTRHHGKRKRTTVRTLGVMVATIRTHWPSNMINKASSGRGWPRPPAPGKQLRGRKSALALRNEALQGIGNRMDSQAKKSAGQRAASSGCSDSPGHGLVKGKCAWRENRTDGKQRNHLFWEDALLRSGSRSSASTVAAVATQRKAHRRLGRENIAWKEVPEW